MGGFIGASSVKAYNSPLNMHLTNPLTPGVTTTPTHPKYQNNNINKFQVKMSEKIDLKILTESNTQTKKKNLSITIRIQFTLTKKMWNNT